MTKKIISLLLAYLLLFETSGCYTTKKVMDITGLNTSDYDSITVKTKDGGERTFKSGRVMLNSFVGNDNGENVSIPLDQISYFKLRKRDSSGSSTSTFLTIACGIVIGLALIFLIIVAVASCPLVSTFDGENWVMEAEPNGGAITKGTEYTDFNVLSFLKATKDGLYKLRLENKLNEIDFNNEFKLLTVDHDPKLTIIPDVNGKLVSISQMIPPVSALTDRGVNLLEKFDSSGELFWDGDINKKSWDKKHPRDEITLKFRRPQNVQKGNLMLKGSNTAWSMYIMGDFMARFGKSAQERLARLEKDPKGKEKVSRFLKGNGGYVEVLVKDGTEWKGAGYFKSVGMFVSKTQLLQFDLPKNNEEMIEVKLRYAPLFWNINKFGIDYSVNQTDLKVTELEPVEAVDSKRGDIKNLLMKTDDQYYTTVMGDRAEIVFRATTPEQGMKRTFILKTSGYYNLMMDKDKELSFLGKMVHILKKQGLDAYSLEKYQELRKNLAY